MATDSFICPYDSDAGKVQLAFSKTLENRQQTGFLKFYPIEPRKAALVRSWIVINAPKPCRAVRAINRPQNAYSTLLCGSALFGSPKR